MAIKPTVILVHGAWTDGSGWQKVIPILHYEDYHTIATQNPLKSLADDVEVTRRIAEQQPGPVILVGHSYGGAVITEAAGICPNTAGLVYISAFAPDAGESIMELSKHASPAAGNQAVRPDKYGALWLDREMFGKCFCQDVREAEASVMAAVQAPISIKCFEDKVNNAGWRNVPSWYQVSFNDRMIAPELEQFMAGRMNAKEVVTLPTSHVPMISSPVEIAGLIMRACRYVENL